MNHYSRLCVFCGNSPINENKEHVLPQWLYEATGGLKKRLNLGVDLNKGVLRGFDGGSFKAPACTLCNNEFSKKESAVKNPVTKLSLREGISTQEAELVLEWMDKVRVGLWLHFRYLDKNYFNVKPQFHINDRINNSDRVLLVYPTVPTRGIGIVGAQSAIFPYMPSVLGLKINGVFLISASSDFLLSSRMGYPFPKMKTGHDGSVSIKNLIHNGRVDKNVFPEATVSPAIGIAQVRVKSGMYANYHSIYRRCLLPNTLGINFGISTGSPIFNMNMHKFCDFDEMIPFGLMIQPEKVDLGKTVYEIQLAVFKREREIFGRNQRDNREVLQRQMIKEYFTEG